MTVCICVKVNECMVFAADSATSFDAALHDPDGNPIMQVYRHGNKLFGLHREHAIMSMTAGSGFFGEKSIAMLAKDFRASIGEGGENQLKPGFTMKSVVDLANDFFLSKEFKNTALFNNPDAAFELWIGGFSDGADRPELWKISVFQGKPQDPVLIAKEDQTGIYCGGQPDPAMRLINGFGYRLEQILLDHGVTPASHPGLYQDIAPRLYLPLAHPAMPIQDAIDLADFLADVTKKVFRFRAVPEYVSGDIDIATITKYERFRWIRRKHFYPETLNRETNHV